MADDRTLTQVSTDLARRWATQRLSAVQTYARILGDFGAGRTTAAGAAGAYAKLVAEETARYASDAFGVASDFAGAVVRKAGGTVQGVATTLQPLQDLDISGPVGGDATAEFVLRNPHDRPAVLSLVSGAFAGPSGDTTTQVMISPAQVTVQAGEEQRITLSAKLDPAVFQPGEYTTKVLINGFGDLVLRVRLSVLPD